MSLQKTFVSVCVLAVGLAGWPAAAGVLLELQAREPGSDAVLARTVFSLEPGLLRLEARSQEGETTVVIFRARESVAWVIDPTAGTYYEITPARVAELGKQMGAAQREMAAELAKMPPEQRRAIEEMMGSMGQTVGAPPPATMRLLARGEQVGAFQCARYEILRGGARTAEIWVAPLEQLQLRREELDTLAALGRMLEPLGQQGPASQLSGLAAMEGGGEKVDGFPVRSLSYDNGQAYREELLVRAERQSFEPKLFELPAGLRKTEFGQEESDEP